MARIEEPLPAGSNKKKHTMDVPYSHSDEDIEKTLEAYVDVLAILEKAIDEENVEGCLEGKKVQPVFREL